MSAGPFFGKYRGTVADIADPERRGRIRAIVPAVTGSGEWSTWALPCLPGVGNGNGLLAVPPVDAAVWIEYERGDPDYPIWVGGFWGGAFELPEFVPPSAPIVGAITLQTAGGNGIVLSDLPGEGGILIRSASGAKISISHRGITIDNGLGAVIEMGAVSVDVNSGALTVR
jgi:uncharacterized protein involved in type VI secretion and phage assembly